MSQEAEKVSELLRHDGKGNNGSKRVTNRLCTSNWAGDVGVTDTELVVVVCVRTEILGFNLIL